MVHISRRVLQAFHNNDLDAFRNHLVEFEMVADINLFVVTKFDGEYDYNLVETICSVDTPAERKSIFLMEMLKLNSFNPHISPCLGVWGVLLDDGMHTDFIKALFADMRFDINKMTHSNLAMFAACNGYDHLLKIIIDRGDLDKSLTDEEGKTVYDIYKDFGDKGWGDVNEEILEQLKP